MITGKQTRGCYAAALMDYDGGPTTQEHYISKGLLKRFGRKFTVEGLPWLKEPRELTLKTMTAGILCERHNNALSAYDSEIGKLFDALLPWTRREPTGSPTVCGDHLERWALKVLFGRIASGNAHGRNGQPALREPPPLPFLRALFRSDPLPKGCGFYFPRNALKKTDATLAIFFNTFAEPDPYAGTLSGVTIQLLGFCFITSLFKLDEKGWDATYRPVAVQLGESGTLHFEWRCPEASFSMVPLDYLEESRS